VADGRAGAQIRLICIRSSRESIIGRVDQNGGDVRLGYPFMANMLGDAVPAPRWTSAGRTVIYLTGVTAEVADAPRLLLIVMFWGLVSLKNDPVYCPLPPVNSAPLQF
jgi:hypothetical protein